MKFLVSYLKAFLSILAALAGFYYGMALVGNHCPLVWYFVYLAAVGAFAGPIGEFIRK